MVFKIVFNFFSNLGINFGLRKLLEELFENSYHVQVVGDRACLTHRVHSQQRVSYVNAFNVDLPCEDVAQSGASGHVAVVDEILEWDLC